jgi:hypothetical protein
VIYHSPVLRWIRFGDAGFKKEKGDKSACHALEKVKAALTARGILSTDSYSLANGSYLTLRRDHRHVDDILRAGAITASALSANLIPMMRCRQIEIEHCFKLVMSGLSEGEGVQSSLCRWLTRSFHDGATTESFVDARVDDFERDCLVFHMSDWTRVLAAGDRLVSEFRGDSPSIHRPQLLLALNNNGVWRPKSLSQTFQDDASSVNTALASLRAEMQELKRETRVSLNQANSRFQRSQSRFRRSTPLSTRSTLASPIMLLLSSSNPRSRGLVPSLYKCRWIWPSTGTQ